MLAAVSLLVAIAAFAHAQPRPPDLPTADMVKQYEKIIIGEIGDVIVPKGDGVNTCQWKVRRVSASEIQILYFVMCEKRIVTPEPPKKFK